MKGQVSLKEMMITYRGEMYEKDNVFRWRPEAIRTQLDFLFEKEQPLDEQALPMPFEWAMDDGTVGRELVERFPSLRKSLEETAILVLFGKYQAYRKSGNAIRRSGFLVANGDQDNDDVLIEFSCPIGVADWVTALVHTQQIDGVKFCSFQLGNEATGIVPEGRALMMMVIVGLRGIDQLRRKFYLDAVAREAAAEPELRAFLQAREEKREQFQAKLYSIILAAAVGAYSFIGEFQQNGLFVHLADDKANIVYDFRYTDELLEQFDYMVERMEKKELVLPSSGGDYGETRFGDDLSSVRWYRWGGFA